MTREQLMANPASLSKLMVVGLLGALSLLLVEIRFEHRAVLGEAWQSWIPLFYSGGMVALGAGGLARWHRGGRQVLQVGFAVAFLIGLLGLWFHSDGHPLSGVVQVLGAWTLRPGASGGIKLGAPPVLAPLAFVGLGSMGVLACSWRFAPVQSVQALDSSRHLVGGREGASNPNQAHRCTDEEAVIAKESESRIDPCSCR